MIPTGSCKSRSVPSSILTLQLRMLRGVAELGLRRVDLDPPWPAVGRVVLARKAERNSADVVMPRVAETCNGG